MGRDLNPGLPKGVVGMRYCEIPFPSLSMELLQTVQMNVAQGKRFQNDFF
jgi:hypothetical protein